MKLAAVPDPPAILSHDGLVFNLVKKIGEGGFARCYEAIEASSNRKLAVKAIHSEAITKLRAKNKLVNEIEIHHHLDHRHIVKLYRVFHDEVFVYLILELCEKQTLVELLRQRHTLTESEVRHYIWMILLAVSYLHSKNIIHRDLKLGNVFLNLESDVKIGDFGLATTLDQIGDRKKTICGTPNYIAPEILFDKERGHSFEVDIWSVGVIMYSLLYGKPPFQSSDIKNIYKNIKDNAYSFSQNIPVSDTAKSLIAFILTPDPDKRPKMDMIIQHEFFKAVIIKEPSQHEINAVRTFCTDLALKVARKMDAPVSPKIAKENAPPAINYAGNPIVAKLSLGKKLSAVESAYLSLCRYLNRSNSKNNLESIETFPELVSPKFYIEKWLDYTYKYGLGYLCSNGNVGAYFNDSTSLVLNPLTRDIEYQCQDFQGSHRQMVRARFAMDEFPSELSKKITIIKHFHSYFAKSAEEFRPSYDSSVYMEFVLKFAKLKDALILRLSNRTLQAMFYDQITILLSQEGLVVTMIDMSTKHQETHYLADVVRSKDHLRLSSKLGIFKEMLESLLTNTMTSNNENQKPCANE